MLYNEVKAEQSFLTLINAAVSHELRNPLNALIGGVETMKGFLQNIKNILEHLKDPNTKSLLSKIVIGMTKCCVKMASSANLIDYFVHDILDYTILTNDTKNFTKDISVFDIRECVEQILVMFEDKVNMKQI